MVGHASPLVMTIIPYGQPSSVVKITNSNFCVLGCQNNLPHSTYPDDPQCHFRASETRALPHMVG